MPLYNEEQNIERLHSALVSVSETAQISFEIIFVNDGSTDKSADMLEALAKADPRIKIIEFSRNFGKERATTAGLHASQGAACLMIDADLQHPPDLIPEFIKKWRVGGEVVVGVRRKNHGEGLIKRAGSYTFFQIF